MHAVRVRNREIGLWPVRIGHKRFHLCGGCAEATQAALDEGTQILGPVVPESSVRAWTGSWRGSKRLPSAFAGTSRLTTRWTRSWALNRSLGSPGAIPGTLRALRGHARPARGQSVV